MNSHIVHYSTHGLICLAAYATTGHLVWPIVALWFAVLTILYAYGDQKKRRM